MKSKLYLHSVYCLFLALSLLTFTFQSESSAAQVQITWDKNNESVDGYKIHYGTVSNTYDHSIDVGNYTSCAISGLADSTTYYFSATAYNAYGESDYSQELAFTMPNEDPAASFYQITASTGPGGSISPEGEVAVSPLSSISYSIQPDAGYRIADVKVDGHSVGAVKSYSFENVSSDHTITASFDANDTAPSSSVTLLDLLRRWRLR